MKPISLTLATLAALPLAAAAADTVSPAAPFTLDTSLSGTPAKAVQRPVVDPSSCFRPIYPPEAVKAGASGVTQLLMDVDAQGKVTNVTLAASSGNDQLDETASKALALCRFKPALDARRQPVPGTAHLSYTWRLDPPLDDPWRHIVVPQGQYTLSSDVWSLVFTGESAANADQRIKLLRRMQDAAQQHASCPSIEAVSVSPRTEADGTMPAENPKLGPVQRRVQELWTLQQCATPMRYIVSLQFREGEGKSTYHIAPLPASAKP